MYSPIQVCSLLLGLTVFNTISAASTPEAGLVDLNTAPSPDIKLEGRREDLRENPLCGGPDGNDEAYIIVDAIVNLYNKILATDRNIRPGRYYIEGEENLVWLGKNNNAQINGRVAPEVEMSTWGDIGCGVQRILDNCTRPAQNGGFEVAGSFTACGSKNFGIRVGKLID